MTDHLPSQICATTIQDLFRSDYRNFFPNFFKNLWSNKK